MFHNPLYKNMGSKSCSNKCDEHMSHMAKHHQNGCQKMTPATRSPNPRLHDSSLSEAKMNPKRQRTSIDRRNISIFALFTKNTMWYLVSILKNLVVSKLNSQIWISAKNTVWSINLQSTQQHKSIVCIAMLKKPNLQQFMCPIYVHDFLFQKQKHHKTHGFPPFYTT